mmetsp:Transcript_106813/g.189825  ORF Transcript_106813/g.189825 Transcript_106813/m.189825 type:complete len:216 (-) Transcript_106813:210-857(-)
MHLNSSDLPEAALDKRHHRRQDQARLAKRPGLKPKLSVLAELPEPASDEENTTGSDHTDQEELPEELPVLVCSSPVAATLDVESEQWPSLREAANDWDFCSELSEASDISAVSATTTSSWIDVSDTTSSWNARDSSSWIAVATPKKSYAAKLLAGSPANQTPQQWPSLKKNLAVKAEESKAPDRQAPCLEDEAQVEPDEKQLRQMGWQKTHRKKR